MADDIANSTANSTGQLYPGLGCLATNRALEAMNLARGEEEGGAYGLVPPGL